MSKKEKGENPLKYLFGKVWHYSGENRKNILLYWLMFFIANVSSLLLKPLIWAAILNNIQIQGVSKENLRHSLLLLCALIAIEIFFWIFHGTGRVIEQINAFKVKTNYRGFILKGIMTQPLEWHSEHHSGDTIDKIEKGTTGLSDFSEDAWEIISAFVQLSVSYAMLSYYSHPALIIIPVIITVTFFIITRIDRVLIPQYTTLNRTENEVSASVLDAIGNIGTVIILRVERIIFGTIMNKVKKPFQLFKKTIKLNEVKWFLTSLGCTCMTVIVLGVYFWQNLGAGILIGNIYLLIRYLDQISDLFYRFANMYGWVIRRNSRVRNCEEIAKDFRCENLTNHVLPKNWRKLDIRNLNFSYEGERERKFNLEDVSLSINRGEKIAFVGETGSGKTTLLKVIRDLYHPQNLDLSVDGKKISEGFSGIARAIALVPQNPEIFATSIRENITLGAEYDMGFVRHFTDVACFTDVADNLPRGFDSSIKEKGVNLSGGQQQRLALSRGLLACHDKDIVLLDEPTSSLDVANEIKVYQNIFNDFEGKSIISSIHRLHLLHLFDRIVFFAEGKIVATGSLDQLLASCSEFKKLWDEVAKVQEGCEV